MVFYAQDYLDKEYLNIQQIVHNLCPSTPVCDPKKYKVHFKGIILMTG